MKTRKLLACTVLSAGFLLATAAQAKTKKDVPEKKTAVVERCVLLPVAGNRKSVDYMATCTPSSKEEIPKKIADRKCYKQGESAYIGSELTKFSDDTCILSIKSTDSNEKVHYQISYQSPAPSDPEKASEEGQASNNERERRPFNRLSRG